MTKIDWSKGDLYEIDPARVQQTDNFVTPDRKYIRLSDLTVEQRHQLAASDKKRAALTAHVKSTAQKKQAAKQVAKKLAQAKRAAERAEQIQRRADAKQKLAIFSALEQARKRSPEFIAAQEAEQARLSQIENEIDLELKKKRASLRQLWRNRLLKK